MLQVPIRSWTRARSAARTLRAWITPRPLLCPRCGQDLSHSTLFARLRVCEHCGYHLPLDAPRRIEALTDPLSFVELEKNLSTRVSDRAYADKIRDAERATGLREAVVMGRARIRGQELVLVVLDFRFLGGTMGQVAGEKIARGFEHASDRELPILVVTASGGARVQEGMLALVQMAKTAAAVHLFRRTGRPFITLLTHPTTGGVYASFANLADVILAEPGALAAFAGPRVVRALTGQEPPRDSYRSEFQLEHGMVDAVVTRPELRSTIARLLDLALPDSKPTSHYAGPADTIDVPSAHPNGFSPWDTVTIARDPARPTTMDYVRLLFDDFVELHGDRLYGDDPAIVAGIARFRGRNVLVVGHERGHGAERKERRNGSALPEGYRKAQRMMHLAGRWNLPLITLVDTPGVALTPEAEERGIASAVANSISAMLETHVPEVAVIIGEGGSGGALALAAADRVLMLEHSVYSVISPEGASAILHGDVGHAEELAGELHLTAHELLEQGIVDAVIPEPAGGAHTMPEETTQRVGRYLDRALTELESQPPDMLLRKRYEKYRRRIGSPGSR